MHFDVNRCHPATESGRQEGEEGGEGGEGEEGEEVDSPQYRGNAYRDYGTPAFAPLR